MHSRKSLPLVLISLIFAAVGSAKDFAWAGRGVVTLDVPDNWTGRGTPVGEVGYNISVVRKSKPKAVIQIILVESSTHQLSVSELKSRLFAAVLPYQNGSLANLYVPEPLTMAQGSGWITRIADVSHPGPLLVEKNWKVTRCAVTAPDEHSFALSTLQSDSLSGDEWPAMLSIVTSLRFSKAVENVALEVTRKDGNYLLTVPVGKLQLKIPAAQLNQEDPAIVSGATRSPRYFYLNDSTNHIIVSGWFESESGYKGIKRFWEKESSNPRLKPQNVALQRCGIWDVVCYDSILQNYHAGEIRAEYAKAGTWIDLHISITSEQPPAETRERLLAMLQTFEVSEK